MDLFYNPYRSKLKIEDIKEANKALQVSRKCFPQEGKYRYM